MMKRLAMGVLMMTLGIAPTLGFAAMGYEEGIAELSKAIVADAAKFQKEKLAVVDFTDLSGNVTELGRFLAEELSVSLVLTGTGLEMVDRTQLNRIFQEQALSFSGVLDPAAVKKVGQIAGVDALIVGTITDLGDTIRLTLKIIATDTGRLISAARTTIPKTKTITMLMEREVVVQRVPGPARPGGGSRPRALPTRRRQETSVPYFENSFLRVTLESIGRSADKRKVTLAMEFVNMSKENLILSIKRYRGRIYANLVDNKGNIFSTSEEKISGIARTNMSEQQENKKQYYTLFTPGGNYTVVMAFKSEQESQGTIYSFSMDCFRYIGGKENKGQYEQFSVGISNMRIQQESKPKGR